jgi:GT2 family glycosyltransferase
VKKMIWIVVPVFNRVDPIAYFLECLSKQTLQDYTLILVDHGEKPVDEGLIGNNPRVKYLKESPHLWWSGAVNAGIRYVQQHALASDCLLLQNDDATFNDQYLENLMRHARELPNAVIGGPILDSHSKKMLSGVRRLSKIKARFPPTPLTEGVVSCDVLPGRGMLVPILALRQVGMMKADILPHYAADDEFSYRLNQAGYMVCCASDCEVFTDIKSEKKSHKSLIEFLSDPRRAGNIPAIYYFSRESFSRGYSMYYVFINILRSIAAYYVRRS